MNQENPFRAAEESDDAPRPERQPAQGTGQHPAGQVAPTIDLERVEHLEQQVEDLQEQVEDQEADDGADEEEAPEPDHGCCGDDCDGWAIEEVEADHVTTEKPLWGTGTRPVEIECPRCGEEIPAREIVPKEEQKAAHGGRPLMSNGRAAGNTLRAEFEEHDRADVLEEAEDR